MPTLKVSKWYNGKGRRLGIPIIFMQGHACILKTVFKLAMVQLIGKARVFTQYYA